MHYRKRCLPGWYIYCSMFSPIIMYVLLLAHRMLGILSDSRDRVLLLQRLQFHLTVNCHQAKAKLARVAAPLQLRYPDLKECEALARLGLRYTDTVRGRLDYILFVI